MKKITYLLLPVILTFVVCAQAEKSETTSGEYPQAPGFMLEDIYGKNIALSDYKGKVIFLNFWATWCGPCRKEIPDFIEAYREYQDMGMVIIGIAVSDTEPRVLSFVENNKINYPVIMGTSKIINDYKPGNYIPATFIIDTKGQIRQKKIGPVNKQFLENWFSELMKEK